MQLSKHQMLSFRTPSLARLFVTNLPFLLIMLIINIQAFAQTPPLWNYKGANWYGLLRSGNLLVGAESGLVALNGEKGVALWQRNDLKGIREDEYHELANANLLLVADNFAAKKGKIEIAALSAETGETVWRTDKLRGFIVQVSPIYDKDILVLLTVANNNAVKDKPDITALKMSTGEFLWNAEYTDQVDLYGVEKTRRSGTSSGTNSNNSTPRRDLSGENPPLFDSDSMYLTYGGLHRYDLKDGKLLWKNLYDVTEGSLKLTNARPIVDGETIYTSAKGILRAINKSDGAVRWTTNDLNKGGVAQTILHDDVIYGRLGGLFYSHKQKDFLIKEPIGVVALDKHTGSLLWEYKDARNSITNMVLIPEQNTLLIADHKRLIGLDTTSRGRVKESYKVKLEFKTKLMEYQVLQHCAVSF